MTHSSPDLEVYLERGKSYVRDRAAGGRDLTGIIQHVQRAEAGYLSRLAWKVKRGETEDLQEKLDQTRQAVLAALTAAAHGEVPAHGPRGGVIWTPRYFVRRVAWHGLDHLWEIEDRL